MKRIIVMLLAVFFTSQVNLFAQTNTPTVTETPTSTPTPTITQGPTSTPAPRWIESLNVGGGYGDTGASIDHLGNISADGVLTAATFEISAISGSITATGTITGTALDINGNADISGDLTGVDDLTATGTITGTALDINGNADISGDLTGVDDLTASGTVTADTFSGALDASGLSGNFPAALVSSPIEVQSGQITLPATAEVEVDTLTASGTITATTLEASGSTVYVEDNLDIGAGDIGSGRYGQSAGLVLTRFSDSSTVGPFIQLRRSAAGGTVDAPATTSDGWRISGIIFEGVNDAATPAWNDAYRIWVNGDDRYG